MPRKPPPVVQPHRRERTLLGKVAGALGPQKAAKIWGVSKQVAYYWKQKVKFPLFHPDTWGGSRHCAFSLTQEFLLRMQVLVFIRPSYIRLIFIFRLIKHLVTKNPITSLFEIQYKVLSASAILVNKDWIARLLRMWGYTWKKPESRNIKKFTIRNMLRWVVFTCWVKQQPRDKLKYLDEVHFEPKSLRRRLGVAPSGTRIIQVQDEYLSERHSMILMTNLDPNKPPFHFRFFESTVNSVDVMMFLFDCIRFGQLKPGDFLILDNAATHFTNDLFEPMTAMLSAAGVTLKFLPTYSPELNPCELVFGLIKNWIRNHRGLGSSLKEECLLALAHTDRDHIKAFYGQCIDKPRFI
jgi:transposase